MADLSMFSVKLIILISKQRFDRLDHGNGAGKVSMTVCEKKVSNNN